MQNQVHLAAETIAFDRSEARNLFETSMKSKFSYFMFLRGASSVQRPQIMHGLIFALELAVGGSIGGFLASLYSTIVTAGNSAEGNGGPDDFVQQR